MTGITLVGVKYPNKDKFIYSYSTIQLLIKCTKYRWVEDKGEKAFSEQIKPVDMLICKILVKIKGRVKYRKRIKKICEIQFCKGFNS